MIATSQDVLVPNRAAWDQLPDGRWEVVEGRAILLPPPRVAHQLVSDALVETLNQQLKPRGLGRAISAAGVFVPPPDRSISEVQSRIPDIAVSSKPPASYFEEGRPPEFVIEILSTRRGSVERSEKFEDYARAGIAEYWIVNPIDRVVEVYRLKDGEYVHVEATGILRPRAFPEVAVEMDAVWSVLE